MGTALAIFNLVKFIKDPSLQGRKKNEAVVGLAGVLGYIAIIAAIYTERGIVLTL